MNNTQLEIKKEILRFSEEQVKIWQSTVNRILKEIHELELTLENAERRENLRKGAWEKSPTKPTSTKIE